MNKALLFAFLAVSPLGCVLGAHNTPANVTFLWTFAGGGSCADVPNVASIGIDIPGELTSADTYPCVSNGAQGVALTNFYPGTYAFTVSAFSNTGQVLYAATGSFSIDGKDVQVAVDLAPSP